MREARELDVVLHSATGLKSASKMAVYCVAWVEPSVRVPSPSTKAHGTHPEFNTTITMSLDDRTLGRGQHLNIEILGQGIVSTRRVGFVRVSLSELLQESANGGAVHTQFNAHPVSPIHLFTFCEVSIFNCLTFRLRVSHTFASR